MSEDAEKFIPHSGKMALLDKIIKIDEKSVECSFNPIKAKHFCQRNQQVPSWLALEYMAQAIGVYVGWHDQKKGLPVKLGFLIGCRKLLLNEDFFIENGSYFVEAELFFKDENLGSFKCVIYANEREKVIAEGTVNVYQPNNIEEFLKENNR